MFPPAAAPHPMHPIPLRPESGMRGIRGVLPAFSLFGALGGTARTAHSQAADSASAHAAAAGFLAAFDSLQWEPFRAWFADDVTMFFPFGDTPARADGRAAVEARFRRFFDEAPARLGSTIRRPLPRAVEVAAGNHSPPASSSAVEVAIGNAQSAGLSSAVETAAGKAQDPPARIRRSGRVRRPMRLRVRCRTLPPDLCVERSFSRSNYSGLCTDCASNVNKGIASPARNPADDDTRGDPCGLRSRS